MKKIITAPHFEKNLHIQDRFYAQSGELRGLFEKRFANPLQATSDRFCWDYWLVPGQYRLLRSPAEAFFGKKAFTPFLEHLLAWGRENLGCQMISHPWLSVYLDGCYQSLHSDVPHGPWSFVYSLTPWQNREFKGGETLLSRPKLLRYFHDLSHDRSDEHSEFFEKIEPKMNRLTVFDPRYPHGVERVSGVEDLSKARVVIHGWFTEPRPMVEGSLSPSRISKPLDAFAYRLMETLEPLGYHGLFTLRLKIGASGKVEAVTFLCAHLINGLGEILPKAFLKKCVDSIDITFPKSNGNTQITLPIELKG
jgi:hypothetical protein